MEHFIFSLAGVESVCVPSVIIEFLKDRCLGILCSYCLVFDLDLIGTTLLNESFVLIVANLTLLAGFELLPSLLFDHCSIGIQVLSLQSDLLELLGETGLFLSFLFLFRLDLAVHFKETLFTCSFRFGS